MPAEPRAIGIIAVLEAEIGSLPVKARPACLAELERRAGERYEEWAAANSDPVLAAGLRVCAAREKCIAEMIEAEFPAPQESVTALKEVLARIGAKLADRFTGSSTAASFADQAAAERAGARAWRQFGVLAETEEQRGTLEICARLETESADFLDAAIQRMEARG